MREQIDEEAEAVRAAAFSAVIDDGRHDIKTFLGNKATMEGGGVPPPPPRWMPLQRRQGFSPRTFFLWFPRAALGRRRSDGEVSRDFAPVALEPPTREKKPQRKA